MFFHLSYRRCTGSRDVALQRLYNNPYITKEDNDVVPFNTNWRNLANIFFRFAVPIISQNKMSQNEEDKAVKVVPRIKVNYGHKIYTDDKNSAFVGNELPDGIELDQDQMPVTIDLFEDLILCFAVDKGESFSLVPNHVLTNTPNLNKEILTEESIKNMYAEIASNIQLQGDPNEIIMVTAGGNYEATLILMKDFWKQMHNIFEGDLVFAVPATDLLFIAKRENMPAILQLKMMIKNYFDNPDTTGLLSKAIYERNAKSNEIKLLDVGF